MSAAALSVVIGRTGLAIRAVVAGLHSRAAPILDEPLNAQSGTKTGHLIRHRQFIPKSKPDHQSANCPGGLPRTGAAFAGECVDAFVSHRSLNTTATKYDHTEPEPLPCSSDCTRRYLTVRCGFAKDMLYKNSCVYDQDHYGDDACFIANHKHYDVVGVADGVGGWRLHGIDPSLFSRSLMDKCAELVEDGQFRVNDPAQLLSNAFAQMQLVRATQLRRQRSFNMDRAADNAKHSNDLLIGSATACVLIMDRQSSKLHSANLGDSGFMVVRQGKVAHRSEEQLHYFNAPYQLTLPPPSAVNDGRFLSDSPDSAHTSSFDLLDGDLIVLATDGLYDNVPTKMIESELANLDAYANEDQLQCACNSIALQARQLSLDTNFMSPFAKRAQEHGFTDHYGGKPDDITIVLVAVTRDHVACSYATRNKF